MAKKKIKTIIEENKNENALNGLLFVPPKLDYEIKLICKAWRYLMTIDKLTGDTLESEVIKYLNSINGKINGAKRR